MRRIGYAFCAALLLASSTLYAQQEIGARATPLQPAKKAPRIYVGPVAGYNRSLHSSSFRSIADDALCPTFESGTDNGYFFGGSFEYLLGNPRDSKSSIIARVLYNSIPGTYTQPGDKLPSLDPNGDVIFSEVQHTAQITYKTLDFEVIYKLNLFNSNFGIVVGPTFGLVMDASRTQRLRIIEPSNAIFSDAAGNLDAMFDANTKLFESYGQVRVVAHQEWNPPAPVAGVKAVESLRDANWSGTRLGVKAGAQYEIVVGKVLVVPCMYYNFAITEVSTNDNLRINALQLGVDIRFAL
jgi:hypothetical protein